MRVIWQYLLGYFCIKIEGFFAERVMNQAIHQKICLWKVKRVQPTIIYGKVAIHDYAKLQELIERNQCEIEVLKKAGLPCVLARYRKRKILMVMIGLVMTILFIISNFIWNIQLEGIESIDQTEFLQELEKDGLKIGMLKRNLKANEIINRIRLDRKDIAWIGIDLSGTNAIVKVAEAEVKPEVIDDEEYCNIVSNQNAQIIKISAKKGTSVVQEGDIVTKGSLLIAGWMEGKYTGTRYVHASGDVLAKVWYQEKIKIPLTQTIQEKTGKTEKKYQLKIHNFQINLYKTLSNFKKYDTIDVNKKIKIFSNFYLPIAIEERTIYEVIDKEIHYGNEEAKQIGLAELSKKIEQNITQKENILQKYENIYAGKNYIEIELIYEVLENIGTKEKIVF